MKKILNIVLILGITIALFSCGKKDPCESIICQNGGTCDNGNCKCPDGYEGNFCQTRKVNNIDVDIELNITAGNAPLKVSARAIYKSGDVSVYTWNFGDNSPTVDGSTSSYTYTKAGTYTITLTASGKNNGLKVVTKNVTVNPPIEPPVANFTTPTSSIIADKTNVSFSNISKGTITSYKWEFGDGESTSTSPNPSYTFTKAGSKTIRLTVTGPLGSNTKEWTTIIYAMPPTCNNYSDGSSQSESKITMIRRYSSTKYGNLTIQNDYSGVIKIELYDPNDWLNGKYTSVNNWYWSIAGAKTVTLLGYDKAKISISNEWGIKIIFANGVESCIRNIGSIASYSANGGYTIKATSIYQ